MNHAFFLQQRRWVAKDLLQELGRRLPGAPQSRAERSLPKAASSTPHRPCPGRWRTMHLAYLSRYNVPGQLNTTFVKYLSISFSCSSLVSFSGQGLLGQQPGRSAQRFRRASLLTWQYLASCSAVILQPARLMHFAACLCALVNNGFLQRFALGLVVRDNPLARSDCTLAMDLRSTSAKCFSASILRLLQFVELGFNVE